MLSKHSQARTRTSVVQLASGMARGRFLRATAIVAGGSALAQAIPILATPILTRLYSPSDMGQLALYLAFISFATTGVTLGYSLAVVAARNEDEAADLTIISGFATCLFSAVAALAFFILIRQNWLGFGNLPGWTAVAMWASIALTGVFFSLRYWLLREGRFRTISRATIAQSIGRVGVQLGIGAASSGSGGLIAGEILGRGAGLHSSWREAWPHLKTRAFPFDAGRLRRVARNYWKFPIISAPSAMLNSLALVLPAPLIAVYFGLQAAGYFSLASRVLMLPIALIGASIGDVFHNRIATYAREHPNLVQPFFLKVAAALFLIGVIPMGVVAIWGEPLWSTVLGTEWGEAGRIASVIAPWALMQFAVSPVSRLVTVLGGQEFKLVYDLMGLASVAGILTVGHNRDWSLIETCTALGWSQALVYVVYFFLLLHIIRAWGSKELGDVQSPDPVELVAR